MICSVYGFGRSSKARSTNLKDQKEHWVDFINLIHVILTLEGP